jgi:hypothetical protein
MVREKRHHMTRLEEEIGNAILETAWQETKMQSIEEFSKAAAEVAKRYIGKALIDERRRIWVYLTQRQVSVEKYGAVAPFEHVARATNGIGETEKWLKENETDGILHYGDVCGRCGGVIHVNNGLYCPVCEPNRKPVTQTP